MPTRTATRRRSTAQTNLDAAAFVVLVAPDDPLDDISREVFVLDEFWNYTTAAGMSKCTILAYDPERLFGRTRAPAYYLLAQDGGERFWMKSPEPYLRYRNLPESLELTPAFRAPAPTTTLDAAAETPTEADDAPTAASSGSNRSKVYTYCDVVQEGVVAEGKQIGKKFKIVRCCCGHCTKEIKIVSGSTGVFTRHLGTAARMGCEVHKAAWEDVIAHSAHTNKALQSDGSFISSMSFEEQFDSNIACLYVIAETNMPVEHLRKKAIKLWVETYNERATVMCIPSAKQIGASIKACLEDKRNAKVKHLKLRFGGGPCCSMQFDLWTDNQGRSWAAVNWIYVEEEETTGDLVPINDVLWFGLFPFLRHTKENIHKWICAVFKETGLVPSMLNTITPDNASDVIGAVNSDAELAPLLAPCSGHGIALDVKKACGFSGPNGGDNPEAKEIFVAHGRVAQLGNQSKIFKDKHQQSQVDAGRKKILKTKPANATRFLGRFENCKRDNDTSFAVDDAIAEVPALAVLPRVPCPLAPSPPARAHPFLLLLSSLPSRCAAALARRARSTSSSSRRTRSSTTATTAA